MELHYEMKMRAWGWAGKIAGGYGTWPKSEGGRSQRAQRRAVWLRCSAWPQNPHPALENVVGGLGTAVGAGAVRWWVRFSLFPPPGAPQSAPREAAARSVRMTRRAGASAPPPLETFFCTERLRVLWAFFWVSNTSLPC
jgi:hypothetical protein